MKESKGMKRRKMLWFILLCGHNYPINARMFNNLGAGGHSLLSKR